MNGRLTTAWHQNRKSGWCTVWVSYSGKNTVIARINQLIVIELLTSCFLENLGAYFQFPGECPFCPPAGAPATNNGYFKLAEALLQIQSALFSHSIKLHGLPVSAVTVLVSLNYLPRYLRSTPACGKTPTIVTWNERKICCHDIVTQPKTNSRTMRSQDRSRKGAHTSELQDHSGMNRDNGTSVGQGGSNKIEGNGNLWKTKKSLPILLATLPTTMLASKIIKTIEHVFQFDLGKP